MRQLTTTLVLLTAIAFAGCTKKEPPAPAAQETAPVEKPVAAAEPIQPLPTSVDVNMEKVVLGRSLYHDTILSGDGTVSCATCHMLDHGGAEPRKSSVGIRGQIGPINSPTVLNSSYNFVQFWDGRAKDLQEQAEGPVANPKEMGSEWDGVVEKLKKNKEYAAEFAKLYPDGVTKANTTDAIAEYEKSLITPSRFDKYLRGDDTAITDAEKKGYATFKEVGCTACHNGILVGGAMFQKMGLVNDYFADRGTPITEADLGRFNVTKNPAEKHLFKVPTLRNVELTSPYLHDGSRATLEETVKVMGKYQLGRDLTDEQVNSIVAFLKSLTGELPAYAKMPTNT
ncbi:MAG: cytochrome-c peroxidase [Myxococcales bacterium]|nr:cytochrome-c peroxidase [Myxococcales bacterium]